MSKHRQHRESTVAASKPATPPDDVMPSASAAGSLGDSILRRVLWQLVALLGVSAALGFTFNAASPLGIRFGATTSALASTTTAPTNPTPATLRLAGSNQTVAVLSPTPPPRVEPTATTMQPSVPVSNPPPAVAAPIPTAQLTPPAAANPAPILWDQAKSLVAAGQAVLVDVRHPSVFAAGHIPGAMSLPETSSPEQFTAFLKNYPTNLMLIVYCSSISCSQSARVATNLVTQYRWPSVKYMTGGYLEYQQDQARNPSGTTP